MKLHGEVLTVAELSPSQRERMFALMDAYYENMRRDRFEHDLAEKQWVIVLCEEMKQVCGFSTQALFDVTVDGRPVRALFSGDTVVDRQYWGDPVLSSVWGRFALSLIAENPGVELYWFLISKGFRTYRYLPLFFHEFFPRPDRPTPPSVQRVLDGLARVKFNSAYDAAAGLVRGDATKDRLRPELAEVPANRSADAYVKYFVERNPGYVNGDELCCLAPLSRENFTAAALRVIAGRRPSVV